MDYGRMAYEMCEQLSIRLNRLEGKSQTKYKEVSLSTYGGEANSRFDKTFCFNVQTDSQLTFRFSLEIEGSEGRSQVVVYINGVKAKGFYTSSDNTDFSITANVNKGECQVDVMVMYFLPINLNRLTLKVGGEVDYLNFPSSISVVNFSSFSYVLFKNGNAFSLLCYDGDKLAERKNFTALDADICKFQNGLMLFTINDDRRLNALLIEASETGIVELDELVLDEGVTQVSGGFYGFGFVCYAIKGSRVYQYIIDENQSFVRQQLDYSASKVYASKSIEDAIILKDFSGNAKLFLNLSDDATEPFVAIKLLKADCYHLENINENANLYYTIGGNVLRKEILDGSLENETLISLTDESIPLFNGTAIERIRTEIILN